jgi:hypothetical protein
MGLAAGREIRGKSDLQPAGVCADFLEERTPRRRRPIRIADIRPRSGIQKSGAVSYRACDRVLAD